MPRAIAVVGPADADAEVLALAYEVGQLVAARGHIVITGGLGGVMAAASRGARDAGGVAVGLLPGDDAAAANDGVTVALPTGLGELRNALVVRAADGLIAVGGSWGTLSEVALAMRAGKPVVCLRGWSVCAVTGAPVPLPIAHSAAEAVQALLG